MARVEGDVEEGGIEGSITHIRRSGGLLNRGKREVEVKVEVGF